MTDRELLELAAKAAGVSVEWHRWPMSDPGCFYRQVAHKTVGDHPVYAPWNPLTDDGDAFRLAVALGLSPGVHYDVSQPLPWLRVVHRQPGGKERWTHVGPEEYAADPYAATRRAITRAAAQIQREREAG